MRYLRYILLFISTNLYAQTYPVPVAIFDTMVFEIRKGRACDSLQKAQANELITQGAELIANQQALKIAINLTESLTAETQELRKALHHSENLTALTGKQERRRGLKIGFGSGVGITALLFLLIL